MSGRMTISVLWIRMRIRCSDLRSRRRSEGLSKGPFRSFVVRRTKISATEFSWIGAKGRTRSLLRGKEEILERVAGHDNRKSGEFGDL